MLEQGTVLATKYELLRPAGFGGMAQLWVAKNRATAAEVCIKILLPENSEDEAVERFRREAYAAARLSHRAIIRIFDLVELGPTGEVTSGKPSALAIVMELLRGETLGDLLMKRGKLPLEEAVDLAIPLVSALAHAHRAGVVHRDLKPDNIFLSTDPDGHVIPKVLDFGVSKMQSNENKPLTFEGMVLGTPSFMSPEQATGKRAIDARSDVFSAGILVYMMLAGKNPFDGESFHSTVSAIVHFEPPRLASVPDAIWNVIAKALAKDTADRFADATELGIALRRASGRTSTTDSGPQSAVSLPTRMRKLVPALGGDSHVSVPPVSGAGGEPLDADDDANEGARRGNASPTARRRALRIVMVVVGASLVLMVAALFRAPVGSGESTTAASQAGSRVGSSTSASAAPGPPEVTASATATATAPALATDAGGAKAAPAPTTTPTTSPASTASTNTPSSASVASRPEKKPAARPAPALAPSSGQHEPSILRDPGF